MVKKLTVFLVLVLLSFSASLMAQETARLQVIHNAADPAADSVDIYLNETLLLDDFKFRTATSFIDAPAGTPIVIGVAPGTSSSVSDTLTSFTLTLTANETYVAIANGVLTPGDFAANPDGASTAFTLFLKSMARESAEDMGSVEFIGVHGATDAPTVDIIARDVATLVDDAPYSAITDYIPVPPASYILDITPGSDNETLVASFEADLSGLAGGSAVVLASGFLTPSANKDGAAFGLIAALANGDVVEFPAITTARLQVIHNAADPAADSVDIYLDGALLLDDFKFRAATPFIDAPAGAPIVIGVAPGTSTSYADTLVTFSVTLTPGEKYVAIANGVLSPDDFAANPDEKSTAFTLFLKDMAREEADESAGGSTSSSLSDHVDFFVVHGSSDAPTVDVIARGVTTLVEDAAYSDITDYIAVPANNYTLDITPGSDNETIVASFAADLSGLAGGSAVVLASGFLTPSANQDGAAFGLIAALANGDVVEFPAITTARLQVIHNAADPAADSVDIYLDGALLLDDFKFRAATPYIDAPAGAPIVIGVAPSTSASYADTLVTFTVTLTPGEKYVAIANGVLSPDDFAANPDEKSTAFTLFLKDMAREEADESENGSISRSLSAHVDFFVVHGSTDAPTVDVIARGVTTLVDNAAYSDITDYLAVPAGSYILDITPGSDNETLVASFEADLSGLAGGSAVVLASGFLTPSANQDGAAFGLIAALANGDVVEFPAITTARLQVIHNAADPAADSVDIYLDGALLLDDFKFRAATPFIDAPAGSPIVIGVAPGTSTSYADTLVTFSVTLTAGEKYVAIANGVLSPDDFAANPDEKSTAFTLFLKDMAREEADESADSSTNSSLSAHVDFFVVHGSTDAPTVDVIARGVTTLVEDAAYSDITDYIAVPADNYTLDITPGSDNETIVASFGADLSGLAGGAAVVLASGFLTPSANQDGEVFGLIVVLPNGDVLVLPSVPTSVQNDPISTVPSAFELSQNYPNPFNPSTTIRFTLPSSENVAVKIYDVLGKEVATLVNEQLAAGSYTVEFEASQFASGAYFYRLTAGNFTSIKKMMLLK